MAVTLDWYGCATFRLEVDGLTLFLDTFMDRPEGAPDVGMSTDRVPKADYAFIGHSHWDHLAGADVIAKRTGCVIIGSHETGRVMRERGVPEEQLWYAQGGERYRLSDSVSVRVFPSLHSCTWTRMARPGTVVTGDYGVFENERQARSNERREQRTAGQDPEVDRGAGSSSTGGTLDFLIETPYGTVFFQDSMGFFQGLYTGIRADVAILSAGGRGNLDGEPFQGSIEQFILHETLLLRPKQVLLNHHDNFTGHPRAPQVTDMTAVQEELARVTPEVELLEMPLGGRITLFA